MQDPDTLFEELRQLQTASRRPPVHQWHPERSGRIDIRIKADGTWWHEGSQIRRQPMVQLFAGILRLDADGFCLVTPAERLRIEVDDAPFVATEMFVQGSGATAKRLFRTNVDDYVEVDAEHPLWVENAQTAPDPYVAVRDGLNARLTRSVFYELVAQASEEGDELCVYSNGARYVLGATHGS